MDKYLSRKEILQTLKIHENTLYNMYKRKEIETIKIGSKILYNLDKYLRDNGIVNQKKEKINICYCRVSSNKQKEDLERQIKYMKQLYPNHIIIKDIGSGLNFKRKGLQKIIDYGIKGELNELVIAYKDRLARFGYDLINNIIEKYSNGKIIIINQSEETTPTEEIVKDILSIMNVYVAKINGLRKYKNQIKKEITNTKN
jgi:putative resolvase